MDNQVLVGSFTIPDELARELSDLLTKQAIRERIAATMLEQGNKAAYEEAENMLIPIVTKIDVLKNRITSEYVPEEFKSSDYVWNYNGYEISSNAVDVLTA